MKFTKILAVISSLGVSLLGTAALAQSTNSPAPVIVETGKVPIPDDIQDLVKKFEKERSAYLEKQTDLEAQLKKATTKAEREAIRDKMKADTAEFLADLKQFRQELKAEINELKGKLNNHELDRLIAEVKHEIEAHNHHAK
jgi:Skp family chaperone for outer membrane proteins